MEDVSYKKGKKYLKIRMKKNTNPILILLDEIKDMKCNGNGKV